MANLTNSAKLIEKVEGLNVTAVWATAPSSPSEWTLWYDTTNDVLKSYDWTNWKEVGSDAADINTKTFYLSSTSDLTTAQAAYDWWKDWKNPIIKYWEQTYLFKRKAWESLRFSKVLPTATQSAFDWWVTLYDMLLRINCESSTSDVVVSIDIDTYREPIANASFLSTNWSNNSFTPTQNYHPATKKYVDDSVSSITVPTKVSDLTNDSNFQTDTQVSQSIAAAVASAYKYKGSVANQAVLPASGNTAGDVYNTEDTGMNYAWTGSVWDPLGATVDLSNYLAKNNTTAFTPSGDYNPATKLYVDGKTAAISWVSTTQPANPSAGAVYYDTTNNVLKVYNWTSWVEVGSGNVIAMTQAQYDALTPAEKADGKLRIITDAQALEIDEFEPENAWSTWDVITKTSTGYAWAAPATWSEIVYCTQSEYDALPSSKLTDWKSYVIYE